MATEQVISREETPGTATVTPPVRDDDHMPIHGIDHVEMYVGNAAQAAFYFVHAFGFTESAGHIANENRIAFWVESRDEVDRIAALVAATPREMQYGPGYYAIFFADPSGNLLEVYHRPA